MPPVAKTRIRHCGDDHRGRDRRSAVCFAGNEHRQVASRGLDHRLPFPAEVLYLLGRTAGFELSADDRDGSRYGAVFADRLLHAQCRLHVLRIGHTMTDDG